MHAIRGTVGSPEFNSDTLDFEVTLTVRFPALVKDDLEESGNTEAFVASFVSDTVNLILDELRDALVDEAIPEIAGRHKVL